MTKVVINTCYGGFSVSELGWRRICEITGMPFKKQKFGYGRDIPRNEPALVTAVEELGSDASGDLAYLEIVELEPGTRYRIQEYDGAEWVETEADIEWSVA